MNKLKLILLGIPIGFVNGFFASGGGVCAVYVLEKVLKIEEKKAHATAIGIILPISLASLCLYGTKTQPDWNLIILCSLGGVTGGVIGAKFLGKIPKRWLKTLFGIVMIISGVRMIM